MKYVSVETYIYIYILTVSCCYVGTRYSDIQNRNLKIQYRSHCGNTLHIWWLYLYKSERLNYVTKINITFKNSWQLVNIVFRNIQMILTWHFWKKSFYLYFSLHYIMRQYHRLVIAFLLESIEIKHIPINLALDVMKFCHGAFILHQTEVRLNVA